MTLEGTVLSTKALRTGEGVSYGYLHRATADTRIALVTGGYAQGVVRALGGRATVLIAGQRLPIVGRVAMDVCVVDVGDAGIPRGATVTFFGGAGASSVAAWASATGLSAAEILTAVGLNATREWTA
jgi:alanine racemase